jgi:F-type H+-transporting ATPase subunit epsilon
MPIRCEVVSQDRIVFQGDVDIVVIPGAGGQMGILPHHAPVLTILDYGIITVRAHGEEQHFTVAGGIAEVQPDQVTILADSAENVEEIDLERASQAKQQAEESLKGTINFDQDRYMRTQSALKRSNLRIEAVRKYRKGTPHPHSTEE